MLAESIIRRAAPAPMAARLAALLGVDTAPVTVEPLELWPGEGQCLVDGERVDLSRREFEVLLALATYEWTLGYRLWPEREDLQ